MSRPNHDRIKLSCDILQSRTSSREYLLKVHEGGFKTACTSAVLGFYGIGKNTFKYSQTTHDVIRLLNRDGLRAENVGRQKENKKVLGRAIKNLNKFIHLDGYYLISTCDHVLLVFLRDGVMSYAVDTNPRANDLRRIESIHKIKAKKYGQK